MNVNITFFTIIWMVVGAYSLSYMIKKIRKSRVTLAALQSDTTAKRITKHIALRRYERERVLLFVEIILVIAGFISIFTPRPIYPELVIFVGGVVPTALILAHVGLAVHSRMLSLHHHELLNIVTAELLIAQMKNGKVSKDVTVAQVNKHRIAVAVLDEEDEDES